MAYGAVHVSVLNESSYVLVYIRVCSPSYVDKTVKININFMWHIFVPQVAKFYNSFTLFDLLNFNIAILITL